MRHTSVRAWSFSRDNLRRLHASCPDASIIACENEADFKSALCEAEIAVVWRFEQEWFELAPRLKWLATPAAGREYLAVNPPSGVKLVFGSFHGELIGETVAGLMLGHCRGLFAAAKTTDDLWPRQALSEAMIPLRGSHVVILGFGAIGRWIGRLIKPFGVRLTGVRRNPPSTPSVADDFMDDQDCVLPVHALDSVLPGTDHLVLALPGGADTDRLLDARRLSLMAPGAVIYNVGRGNAIDEAALAKALRDRKIAAAYLDVFDKEPLPADSPLRACSNAFLLPHISAVAPNYLDLFLLELAGRMRVEWRR